jgi:hypothetical protein
MDNYILNSGEYKTIIDGNLIDEAKWNVLYDGENLEVEGKRNNEQLYFQLNNDELMKLLELSPDSLTMDKRLNRDLKTHNLQVKPIIIEEVYVKPRKKKVRYTKRKIDKSKQISRDKSKGKSKGKSKSKHSRKSKKEPVPDFLRTIY